MNFDRFMFLLSASLSGFAACWAYNNEDYHYVAIFSVTLLCYLFFALISRTKKTTVQDK